MKKIFCILIFIFAMTAVAFADEISVTVDGERVIFADQQPVIVDGRTLVPVRGVFEMLGFNVHWNNENRQTELSNENYTVILTLGSVGFTTNGFTRRLDVPPQSINGRTMLPLRAVVESVGYNIAWDAETRTVRIFAGERPPYITIQGIQYRTDLTDLLLPSGNLTNEDIAPLIHMTDLTRLLVYENQISDITPLARLTNLTSLVISGNPISDITLLAGLTNLTGLVLSDNQISDITPLAGLTGLSGLYLSGNQISDITPLAGLTYLAILDLIDNQISDIPLFAELESLWALFLDSNQISDITPLASIPRLSFLALEDNPITDWSPISRVPTVTGRP
jgi:hypothetical protein